MTVSFVFPAIAVRDTVKPERRKREAGKGYKLDPWAGAPSKKYDHAQMLRDRINGMTWEQIAKKHGVQPSKTNPAGANARRIALHSAAARRLTTAEAAAVDGIK